MPIAYSRAWTIFFLIFICFAASQRAAAQSSPATDAFYFAPSPLPYAPPGTVIRTRALGNSAALPSAGRNLLVLYHSKSIDGRDIAVSGTIAVPRGKPPVGGWPLTTWGHGTTGISPVCAPSRDTETGPEHPSLQIKQRLMDDYVKSGYAVVATDYERLGPPGPHPFLQGESEGRGIIDIMRAAREIDPNIGTRYVVVGHSQGGHADLFSAAIGPGYAPELTLLGNVAIAPASHIAVSVQSMTTASKPSYALGYVMYVLESFASNHPQIDLKKILTSQALAHLPLTRNTCISKTVSQGYWATSVPSKQFKPDADLSAVLRIASANEPGRLHISSPTLVLQGSMDDTVLPSWTDTVARSLCKADSPLLYAVYPNATHETIVTQAAPQIRLWIGDRFAGRPPASNCKNLPSAAQR